VIRAGVLAAFAVAALVAWSGEAVAAPPPALLRALLRTTSAGSANLSLTERVTIGSQTITLRLRGIEQPRAKAGSFVFSLSPAQPGLGQATEIVRGSKVYVHYGVLDTLHAKNPSVKSWILVDAKSSLGIDPVGVATLGAKELREMTGIEVVGAGTEGGVRVTRYRGTLDLRRAASSPQLQQLLSHLPSAAAVVLDGTERVEFSVGADGYIHHITSSIAVSMRGGGPVRVAIDATFADFDRDKAPLVPPPASEVMTLLRFNQLMGVPTGSGAALIAKLVLRASQVGAGYVRSPIPGGQLVQGERTLDYCGLGYPSEALRTARLQVVYTKRRAGFKASNEVVAYKPGGAQQALREVRHAAAACPEGEVKNPPAGVTKLIHHGRLVTDPHLLPGAVAILDHEIATIQGRRVTVDAMEVYQVRGNLLSGVYGTAPTPTAVEAATLHAAEQSAANLKRSVPAAAGR
jgi:hypothetical protein